MRLQYSLKTVAIFVTVFCCLLGMFPVTYGIESRVSGVWIHSPRLWSPSQPMIGFVRQKFGKTLNAYYVCMWCYEQTSVPAAVVYLADTSSSRPVSFNQSAFQVQTMDFPLTSGWKIALSIMAALLFVWYPLTACRKSTRRTGVIFGWWLLRLCVGIATTQLMGWCLLNFAFQR